MKQVNWLVNDIGVDEIVYQEILQHCLDYGYDDSGFNYYICGSFDDYDSVLRFAVKNEMITPMDLVDLDTNTTELFDFITDLSFASTRTKYEFVFSASQLQWYLLRY